MLAHKYVARKDIWKALRLSIITINYGAIIDQTGPGEYHPYKERVANLSHATMLMAELTNFNLKAIARLVSLMSCLTGEKCDL